MAAHAAANVAWADVLGSVLRGVDLTADETSEAMDGVMSGDVSAVALAGLLVALRAKGETSAEIVGFVESMLAHANLVNIPAELGPVIDTCGTGGDRANTVNVSTMAAVVAAAAGARVVKHGNRAASSSSGSADVLEALGVAIDLPAAAVIRSVEVAGIGFCFAPLFHPGMRHAAQARRELSVPTVFNILGPLANPASPAAQVVGCYDVRLAGVMAEALKARGSRAMVVRGTDGLDEISTAALTDVWDARGEVVEKCVVDTRDLGIHRSDPEDLRGGDARTNALVARAVLDGSSSGRLGAVRDAVLVNAAAALVVRDAVDGIVDDLLPALAAALPKVTRAIDDGHAAATLEVWARVSTELSSDRVT